MPPRLAQRTLMLMLRRIGTALRAGIDARKIWEQEAQRAKPPYSAAFSAVRDAISRGESWQRAMQVADPCFPSMTVEMVGVGEATGRLDEVLLQLADHYEHLLELRRSFLTGIMLPAIQFAMALLIVGGLIWFCGFVTDKNNGETIDLLGFGLIGTRGVIIYFGLVAGVFATVGFGALGLRNGWFGPAPLQLVMRIPVVGKCLETNSMARMAWTLAMTLDSGLEARRALRMSLRSTQMPYYTEVEQQADEVIAQGREFHEALRATHRFPDEFLDALESAEHAGSAAESMVHVSRDYNERAKTANRLITIAASFGTWACVAGFIIFLIFRLAMFYVGTINDALKGL